MTTDTQQQEKAAIPTFSPEVAKAEISLSLTKEGLIYQTIIQECENIVFTEDNISDPKVLDKLKVLRSVKTKIEAIENPYTPLWRGYNEAKKSLQTPADELLKRKEAEFKVINAKVEAANKKIAEDKARLDGIRSAIDTFFLDQSQAIAAATTPEQLVAIEKLIGSHKANSARYGELLPDLNQKASELTPLIKTQKEYLKKLETLKGQEMAAESTGDDQAVLDIREAQEAITQRIGENKEIVQEKAIEQATAYTGGYSVPIPTATKKARLTKWKAEIVDKKVAISKSLELLDVTLNSEKINASIKTLKDSGVFKDKTEHIVNGIRYYEDKSFL